MEKILSPQLNSKIIRLQQNELTEYYVYNQIAKRLKDEHNAQILTKIGNDELAHSNFWQNQTKTKVKPQKHKIWFYLFLARFFGITFSLKLMERNERKIEQFYQEIEKQIPSARKIIKEEQLHENALINLIDEDKLRYIGAIVLGLNDALIELTGALSGLTFAIQNPKIIALAGLITGIAASFSMAVSWYLSAKADSDSGNYKKSAIYTGIAYLVTVGLLVFPFLIFTNPFVSLVFTILIALGIISIFNFYISITKDLPFKQRFLEMLVLNLIVVIISFAIGILLREITGIDL
ncbi:MAG: VIT1/CCC1 transporter family protein [Candidatus Kapaibacteriales bacterium]